MTKQRKTSTQPNAENTPKISIRRFFITYLILMAGFFFVIGFTPLQKIVDIKLQALTKEKKR